MFRNAAWLFGSTIVTSGFGFLYWVAAARLMPAGSVGIGSAAISAMLLITNLSLVGLSTLVIGELAGGEAPDGLVTASLLTTGGLCALVSAVYVLIHSALGTKLGPLGVGVWAPVLFIVGASVTAITWVLDAAAVGMDRGGVQFARNTIFSVTKLCLLVAGALLFKSHRPTVIYAAWLGGNLISLASYRVQLRGWGAFHPGRPAFGSLFRLRRTALAHHWITLAAQGPVLLLPVVMSAVLLPAVNASFYVTLMVVNLVAVIPIHFSTALFALPRGNLERLAVELRSTLRASFAAAGLGAVAFVVLAQPILQLFGPEYLRATDAMMLLGLSNIPFTIKCHYAAVSRIRGNLMTCAWVSLIGGLFELAGAYAGARWDSVTGASLGFLVVVTLEGAVLWPYVARAARVPVLAPPAWLFREKVIPQGADGGSSRSALASSADADWHPESEIDTRLPTVSVVIPTYNRRDALEATLQPLLEDPATLEVIVVVDGCNDGSFEMLQNLAGDEPKLKPVWQDNAGQGVARETGLTAATGEIVMFVDDDVVAEPGLVTGHQRMHEHRNDLVVLGYMPLDLPRHRNRGQTASYIYDRDYEEICATYERDPTQVLLNLWSGNMSLRREAALAVGVAGSTTLGYHEDKQFGYRCAEAGMQGVFSRNLGASHRHQRTVEQFRAELRRQVHARRHLPHTNPETDAGAWVIWKPAGIPRLVISALASKAAYERSVAAMLATINTAERLRLWFVGVAVLRILRQVDLYHLLHQTAEAEDAARV